MEVFQRMRQFAKSTSDVFKAFPAGRITLFLFLIPLDLAGVASAASFTVNSTKDAVDAAPGNGICDDGAGNCTLRAAIMEANLLPGTDSITLPEGTYTLSIAGRSEDAAAQGDLDITDDLTIRGDGKSVTIVDVNQLDRVMDIHGSSVLINGLTVQNGDAQSGGGGILNEGTLILINSTVRLCTSSNGAGGIYNKESSTLTLNNSTLSNNNANSGGAIRNDGTLILNNSTLSDNNAGNGGGGIWHVKGRVEITNSTISNNNGGEGVGGGILIGTGSGPLMVKNSTLSSNTSALGGGIFNSGTLILSSATVSGNTATIQSGGIHSTGFDSVRLGNTIIAGNKTASVSPDCNGQALVWASQGYNLIGNGGDCGYVAAVGDQVGTTANPIDPQLGPLQDNGGLVETHALLTDPVLSPAIDAGNPDGCTDFDDPPNLLRIDQRGEPRPVDGDGDNIARCDIGAFEGRTAT